MSGYIGASNSINLGDHVRVTISRKALFTCIGAAALAVTIAVSPALAAPFVVVGALWLFFRMSCASKGIL